MIKKPLRVRLQKRFQRIARKHNISNAEVQKVWKSQFRYAKETLEGYTYEELSTFSEEKLNSLVINFLFIGKIHSNKKLQEFGNKKHNIKDEKRSNKKDR